MESFEYLAFLGIFFTATAIFIKLSSSATSYIDKERDNALTSIKEKYGRRKKMDAALIDAIYSIMEPTKIIEKRAPKIISYGKIFLISGVLLSACGLTLSHFEITLIALEIIDVIVYLLFVPLGIITAIAIHYFVRV